MKVIFHIIIYFVCAKCGNIKFNLTRRIIRGNEAHDTRPYMVYLRPLMTADKVIKESNWLCGGVIIHAQYILTSAACIEDIQQFFVVSGTHQWSPLGDDDDCIQNGAKRAVWKCVPQGYVFDGRSFDNIRWMAQDLAVVKLESEINFKKKVLGCDFIPQMIPYNNISWELEAPGVIASTAGWGSTEFFSKKTPTGIQPTNNGYSNSPVLLEAEVVVTSKNKCKKAWPEQYHTIIDEHMICGKDGISTHTMTNVCKGSELTCKELIKANESEEIESRKSLTRPDEEVHSASHFHLNRRNTMSSGGFCENDHGGPLVKGYGNNAIVIGIISACLTANVTHRCHGPFLYTSVNRNRNVISCAIYNDKEFESQVRKKTLLPEGFSDIIPPSRWWDLNVSPYKPGGSKVAYLG